MTDLLEQAIERVRALPQSAQDAFARVLLELASDGEEIYLLTVEEEADLIAAEGEYARGEVADDARAYAVFAKYDR